MNRNRRVAAVCNLVAGICFAVVSYGDFYRGRTARGGLFAVLSALQLAMALANALRPRRKQIGSGETGGTNEREDSV